MHPCHSTYRLGLEHTDVCVKMHVLSAFQIRWFSAHALERLKIVIFRAILIGVVEEDCSWIPIYHLTIWPMARLQ